MGVPIRQIQGGVHFGNEAETESAGGQGSAPMSSARRGIFARNIGASIELYGSLVPAAARCDGSFMSDRPRRAAVEKAHVSVAIGDPGAYTRAPTFPLRPSCRGDQACSHSPAPLPCSPPFIPETDRLPALLPPNQEIRACIRSSHRGLRDGLRDGGTVSPAYPGSGDPFGRDRPIR